MQSLKMKSDQLDEYIAEHETLIAELDWDGDSEMSCHSFREGLPTPLAKQIIQMKGIPESLTQWVKYAQKYHSRWVMSKALGYHGKKSQSEKSEPQWNTREKKKERDPDAMDIDFSQMTKEKKEWLMKSGSCFKCEQQGHLSKDCPQKGKMTICEATTKEPGWTLVKSNKRKAKEPVMVTDKPPSYDSILKQINACTMEDRQKILKVFSQDNSSKQGDF